MVTSLITQRLSFLQANMVPHRLERSSGNKDVIIQ